MTAIPYGFPLPARAPARRTRSSRGLWPMGPILLLTVLRCCSDGCGTVIDDDDDGFAAPESTEACAGWPNGFDCDDGDPSIHPNADDPLGDDIDQNCDGADGVLAPNGDGGVLDDGGSVDDAGSGDAGTSSNLACSFNDDCPAAERCECDEATGCFCRLGARGTGVNGVDTCEDGNDCASAVCVEGNGAYYCSGECVDGDDCGPQLPVCADIAFVGRICIREAS